MLDGLLQAIIQGVLLGGYYAIIAAGLSLMVGVVRFINLAHGDLAVLGAMLTIALGWAMHASMFERAMKGGFLLPILVTVGLGAALQNGMYGIWGSDIRSLGASIGGLALWS